MKNGAVVPDEGYENTNKKRKYSWWFRMITYDLPSVHRNVKLTIYSILWIDYLKHFFY